MRLSVMRKVEKSHSLLNPNTPSVRCVSVVRCLFSGQRLPRTESTTTAGVDAAHILPWSRYDLDAIPNGVCLNKQCHWAFDEGLFRLTFDSSEGAYAVTIPDPRQGTNRPFCQIDSIPFLLHFLNECAEMFDVSVHIHTRFFRRASHGVEPAIHVGRTFDDTGIDLQDGVTADKGPIHHTKQITRRFETFYISDLVARRDGISGFDFELCLDQLAEHSGGKFRKSDFPQTASGLFFRHPIVTQ